MRVNYTTINHTAREQMGLSWLEYGLADLIYNLSNHPTSKYQGWCYASKQTLAELMGMSKQGIHKILLRLIEKGIVEKDEETKYLKISFGWYEKVLINDSKQSLPVNKVDSKQSLPVVVNKVYSGSKQSLHNKDIYNDIDKDNITYVMDESAKELVKTDKKVVYGSPDINEAFDLWEKIVGYRINSNVKRNRIACSNMLKKMSKEDMAKVLKTVDMCQKDNYSNVHISDFIGLQRDFDKLKAWNKRQLTKNKKGLTVIS